MTASYAKSAPDVKLSLIHPATEAHIKCVGSSRPELTRAGSTAPRRSGWSARRPGSGARSSSRTSRASRRACVTLPKAALTSQRIQWVYNILEHKKEAERIVYECGSSRSPPF